jgi:diguanylate cyclase (GGDEF)-like protein
MENEAGLTGGGPQLPEAVLPGGSPRPQDDQPVLIAERTWWVGHRQPNDPFQCHVYLIEQGDQSVLIDPGSNRTIQHTLRKIEQITPLSNIRYIICQHQDPDITAALPLLDSLITRPDAVIVTHWRAEALLKHYDTRIPFWRVEDHDWVLPLPDRQLEFVFTPYAHFPGAFCTFDRSTGVLFSSDLCGGFTPEFSLFAKDMSCFDGIRSFHEHYMPSREILAHAMDRLMEKPVRMIAPQHGSILPQELVKPITEKLSALDCGLYLLAREHSDIRRLSELNTTLRDIVQTMVLYRDFRDIAGRLLSLAQRFLPAERLEFFAKVDEGKVLHLAPATRYRGTLTELPARFAHWLGMPREDWFAAHGGPYLALPASDDGPPSDGRSTLAVPLFTPSDGSLHALALFHLTAPLAVSSDVRQVVDQMALPLQVAIERECIYRALELERERFFQRSIRDPLTGLFTRLYMNDIVQHLVERHERDAQAGLGLVMIDIDHFKAVNDTYGHGQGDVVLAAVAQCLRQTIRKVDIPVRVGGEEFAIFIPAAPMEGVLQLAERLRAAVAALAFDGPMTNRSVTISLGTAAHRRGELLPEFLARADAALYRAKKEGRDRVRNAEEL